jgi:cyclopropane-fatty-acyl-phospholipid synthase
MALTDKFYRKLVLDAFARARRGELKFTMPGGSRRLFGEVGKQDKHGIEAELIVKDERFYRRCVHFGAIGFAESHLSGEWDSKDLTKTIAWFILNGEYLAGVRTSESGSTGLFDLFGVLNRLGHLLRPNSKKKSRDNIGEHYDLGNDFFKLWLDPTMTYSAAYFDPPELTMEDAQRKKWERICQKLQISSRDMVLEIGCGWGGFAIHAAKHHGCRVTAATISEEQFREATARVAQAGVSDLVEVIFCDYRDLSGRYDKIVSIEMLEAVGDQFVETFFKKVSDLLSPSGLVGIQTILCPDNQFPILRDGVDFIQKHIFPGSLLLSMRRITEALNSTGDLNLLDYEDMTPFYARTLQEWRIAFRAALPEIRKLGYDEGFIRKWFYYLCYCEAAFGTRHIAVAQIVFTRPDNLDILSHAYDLGHHRERPVSTKKGGAGS